MTAYPTAWNKPRTTYKNISRPNLRSSNRPYGLMFYVKEEENVSE
jgi:hypothetical protein